MICLSLTGSRLSENLEQIKRYRPWISLVELRGDFLALDELNGIRRFPKMTDLPVILTLRRKSDGGAWSGEEQERLSLFSQNLDSGFAYMDLEEDLPSLGWEESWRGRGGQVIRSFHDFSGVPEDLEKRAAGLARGRNEIPKAAVTPRSGRELLRIFDACRAVSPQPKIILGMGNLGIPSRILARRLGCFLCYSSAGGTAAAPGHMDPKTLEELYGYSRISQKTRIFGILGYPVMHSLSPFIHNSGFLRTGTDAVYLPLEMEDPAYFLGRAGDYGFEGFSVTHPHKESILPLLQEKDSAVDSIGSCNTLILSVKGGWRGRNTDAAGFAAPLEQLWQDTGFAGKTALVIGAGGAARAVIWELLRRGCSVFLANRSSRRAEELAGAFNIPWSLLGQGENLPPADLVVQASSLGMPGNEGDPAPAYRFSGKEIVYDLIYRPEETAFLRRAGEAGCLTLSGLRMLYAQAKAQFKLFSGKDFPPDLPLPGEI